MFFLICIVIWFYLGEVLLIPCAGWHRHRSRGISGTGTTLIPAPGEAQDGLHRRPWRVKDETLTLKGWWEEQSRAENTLICAFVYVFHLYCDVILFGGISVILCATVYLCCAKFSRVPCLSIQRGCKREKVSWDTAGSRASRESQLSETPIVWRNTSVTFAREII